MPSPSRHAGPRFRIGPLSPTVMQDDSSDSINVPIAGVSQKTATMRWSPRMFRVPFRSTFAEMAKTTVRDVFGRPLR